MKIGQAVYDLRNLHRGVGTFNGYCETINGERARVRYPGSKVPRYVRRSDLSLCPYRVERRQTSITRWMQATGLSEQQLRSSDQTDWKAVNEAIIQRWSKSGLNYIKERAWKIAEGKIKP